MDLFTCALAMGLAMAPVSEGYIEYSTATDPSSYICYGDPKDNSSFMINAAVDVTAINEIIFADFSFTGRNDFKHITCDLGVQYKFANFTPYLSLYGNYLNDEKSPKKTTNLTYNGFQEEEFGLKLGVKMDHQLIKNINFFGDFALGYDFYNALTIDTTEKGSSKKFECSYLSNMFRAELKIGARFFNLVSIYGGIQSWQTIGYSEDTGSIFGGSTPCMVRNEIGFQIKPNFAFINPYITVDYLCQHPEKPYDNYNRKNHAGDYLNEQFNYNNMEIKAGIEVKF